MQYGHLPAPKLMKKVSFIVAYLLQCGAQTHFTSHLQGTEDAPAGSEGSSSSSPGWFPSTASDEDDAVKDDVDHDDDQTEFASSSSINTEGEGERSTGDGGKKGSSNDSDRSPMRDLRGIVMDAVIVGAPLCSTVRKNPSALFCSALFCSILFCSILEMRHTLLWIIPMHVIFSGTLSDLLYFSYSESALGQSSQDDCRSLSQWLLQPRSRARHLVPVTCHHLY